VWDPWPAFDISSPLAKEFPRLPEVSVHNAVAFANNDLVTIAWSYDTRPDGCLGFAVYRLDPSGARTPLPSHAVWPDDQIKPSQTTVDYPIQKFSWKDPYARLEAERTGQRSFRYAIVALHGAPHHLQACRTCRS
jgi:hypothetical protein